MFQFKDKILGGLLLLAGGGHLLSLSTEDTDLAAYYNDSNVTDGGEFSTADPAAAARGSLRSHEWTTRQALENWGLDGQGGLYERFFAERQRIQEQEAAAATARAEAEASRQAEATARAEASRQAKADNARKTAEATAADNRLDWLRKSSPFGGASKEATTRIFRSIRR